MERTTTPRVYVFFCFSFFFRVFIQNQTYQWKNYRITGKFGHNVRTIPLKPPPTPLQTTQLKNPISLINEKSATIEKREPSCAVTPYTYPHNIIYRWWPTIVEKTRSRFLSWRARPWEQWPRRERVPVRWAASGRNLLAFRPSSEAPAKTLTSCRGFFAVLAFRCVLLNDRSGRSFGSVSIYWFSVGWWMGFGGFMVVEGWSVEFSIVEIVFFMDVSLLSNGDYLDLY